MGLYRPLLQIKIEHSYFADKVCRGLRFTLTEDSARLLDRASCLVRQTDDGVVLLRDVTSSVHEPFVVHWQVRASDALFSNYTASAEHAPRTFRFPDPHAQAPGHDDATAKRAGDSRVIADALASLDSYRAPLQSRNQQFPLPDFTLTVVVTTADLDHTAEGARQLVCRLQARATVWKYCLIGDWIDAQNAQPVEVVDLAQAWQFEAAVSELLPHGQMAWALRSTRCIPLQDRSDKRFQLRQRSGGTDKVLIKRLPVASPRYLSRETSGGLSTQVSEIYLHR